MKRTIPLLLLLLVCSLQLVGYTSPPTDYRQLLKELEISLLAGNKRALRDLGSLLDQPEARNKARRLIANYTLFTPEEFVISNPLSRAEFLQFYYTVEADLQYSALLNAYYLTDPEDRKVNYKIGSPEKEQDVDESVLLNEYIQQLEKALTEANDDLFIQGINHIETLHRIEGIWYLAEMLNSNKLQKCKFKDHSTIYQRISLALESFADVKTLNALLGITKKDKLDLNFAQQRLANLTNIYVEAPSTKLLVKKYHQLLDSLSTVEELRAYGYRKKYNTRSSFFMHPVDYYGWLMSKRHPTDFWIEHNAIKDLCQSQHPRAMLYLAGLLYKYRTSSGKAGRVITAKITNQIDQMTQLIIRVEDKEGTLSQDAYRLRDKTARLNYFGYWASHYQDYEWDENRAHFVNKHEAIETTQNYERLFRRLNSRNDSVAIASFIKLTDGEPNEVMALSEKYRQMFRNYNPSLPSFQYKYLEQLSELTYYCRKNNINYRPSPTLEAMLSQLKTIVDPKERIALENQLIKHLTLEEVTAVEFWACLHEGQLEVSYSIGRILDWFYSKSMQRIMNDNNQLRLYLKKANIFGNIGAIGTCNYYLNKFSLETKDFQERLKQIEQTESDEGILNQLSQLLISDSDEDGGMNSFTSFLEDPNGFHKRDIKILPAPKKEQYPQLISAISAEEDIRAIRKILFYIRLHANVKMVPNLFNLLDDQRVLIQKKDLELTVADNLAPILETIYNYSFPEEADRKKFDIIPWQNLWETNAKNYENWAVTFFENKINLLVKSDVLDIEDINQITASGEYNNTYKDKCLLALQKVQPVKDIRQLNIIPKLVVSTDLVYFDSFDFDYKVLDDIPKLFDIDDPVKMLNYLEQKAAAFKIEDKGSFYNNLFRSGWFLSFLGSNAMTSEKAIQIRQILQQYYEENAYLSEFEEQATQFNIAQLEYTGKSMEEQLLASIAMNTDEASRVKIQESILARITYQQLPLVIKLLPQLSPELLHPDRFFLAKDFGLPIFSLDDEEERVAFIDLHQKLSEQAFYRHYLREFGVNFETNDQELDFQKIYHILHYDVVSPFVSSSGGKRDYYTYGVIKLLELHFADHLGFHQKLNEAQTFYTFSSTKRAAAWIKYLKTHQFIDPQQYLPPSFNLTKAD